MFGLGIGIVLLVIIVALLLAYKSNSHSIYQVLWGMVLGLLLASIAPGLPNTMNQTVKSVSTSIQNIDWNG